MITEGICGFLQYGAKGGKQAGSGVTGLVLSLGEPESILRRHIRVAQSCDDVADFQPGLFCARAG
ncbi:MAG: hypothetical protein LBL49_09445, partial [Clostridiales Family XIII bacterium]|nr:hypothetical protein [Clostridiales Family XIII bacterium]